MADIPNDNIIIGTTVDNQKVTSPFLDTNKLRLGWDIVNKITHDPLATQMDEIPSAAALSDVLHIIQTQIDQIDPNHIGFKDHSVVSLSVINPILTPLNTNITFRNWEWGENDYGLFTMKDMGENRITIPSIYFPQNGYYFVVVDIETINSGELTLFNNSGVELKQFFTSGRHVTEVFIENSDTEYLNLQARYLNTIFDIIKVNGIHVHRVYDRIRLYIDFLIQMIGVGGTWATENWVLSALESFKEELNQSSALADLTTQFTQHLSENNPHHLTPDTINAAAKNHTHTPDQCGAAAEAHIHTPQECGAAATNHTHIPSEIGGAATNHTHTPDQCGAAAEIHGHDPIDIGAASTDHTHIPEDINAASKDHTHTPFSLGAQPVGNYVTQEQFLLLMQNNISKYDSHYGIISTTTGYILNQSFANQDVISYPNIPIYSSNTMSQPYFNSFEYNISGYDYYNTSVYCTDAITQSALLLPDTLGLVNSPFKDYDTPSSYNTDLNFAYFSKYPAAPAYHLGFRFQNEKRIKGYTIISPKDYEAPRAWEIRDKNSNVIQSKNISASDYVNNMVTYSLPNTITTDVLEFYMTESTNKYASYLTSIFQSRITYPDPSLPTNQKQPITGIKIYFWEENTLPVDNKIIIHSNPLTYHYNENLEILDTLSYELDLTKFPKNTKIPYYFYIYKSIDNDEYHLQGTPIPCESGQQRLGTAFIHKDLNKRYIPNNQLDDTLKFTETAVNKQGTDSIFNSTWTVSPGLQSSTVTLNFEQFKIIPRIKIITSTGTYNSNAHPDLLKIEAIMEDPNLSFIQIPIPIGTWNENDTYALNQIIMDPDDNRYYYSLIDDNVNLQPSLNTPVSWTLITNSSIDEWNIVSTYNVNNVVMYELNYYIALTNVSAGIIPDSDSTQWMILGEVLTTSSTLETYPTIDIITVPLTQPYGSNYNSKTNQYETEVLLPLTYNASPKIKTLILSILATKGQSSISIEKVILYLSYSFYNTIDGRLYNHAHQTNVPQLYLGYGYINVPNINETNVPSLYLYPIHLGNYCILPINSFSINSDIAKVPNPYLTKYVTCTILRYDHSTDGFFSEKDNFVISITDEIITVNTQSTNIDSLLKVVREW
jgi:hypothetical protein